jgi:dephospho-CoA kinase
MIIGITGTLGAGKGTATEYLVQKGFKHFAVSDTYLRGEAVKRGIEPTREARRDIANEVRAKGPTKLMEALYEIAVPDIEAGHGVVIEPQHTAAEVRFIQEKGGIVLSVDADLETRYERIKKRGSAKDHVSFEEFAAEQRREMASNNPDENNLGAAIAAADYQLTNSGTLEALHAQIDEVLKQLKK